MNNLHMTICLLSISVCTGTVVNYQYTMHRCLIRMGGFTQQKKFGGFHSKRLTISLRIRIWSDIVGRFTKLFLLCIDKLVAGTGTVL